MQQNLDLYSTPWNEFTGNKQILLSFLVQILGSGQMDSQVVASGCKLNLHRDLHWVAKRTRKFPHKYTQVAKNPFQEQHNPVFHWLIIG